jgi:RHS repeat-associated protein
MKYRSMADVQIRSSSLTGTSIANSPPTDIRSCGPPVRPITRILTWRQERAGSAAKIYTFGHDLVDQLTSAVLTDTNSTPTILKRQAWSYDAAGNRTVDQTDDAVFASTHNSLNHLGSRAPGGPIVFAGSLNEEGTVTIDGKPATVDGANNFRGTAMLTGATSTVTLKAKDASGNETTKQYEVDASGSTTSYTYDANGNLTSDGTKTYFWNALNQLVEVKEGTTTIATFEYDGAGRRTEKVAAGLTHQYIYDAEDIVEERITGSSTDTIRYYHGAGIDEPLARKNSSDVVTYYLADHLGSIVQETNASGVVTLEREYGPWGDLLSGASTAGYAFQGREWDAEITFYYFRARYYNAAAGAWASEDPIGFAGGPNFSQFIGNNPVRFIDPFGLCSGENEQDRQDQIGVEFKPGTTEEEKRLIRQALGETGDAVEWILIAASLGQGGSAKAGQTMRDTLLNAAKNPRLRDAINNLYRPGAKIGSGSSMDAVRAEGSHVQKVIDRRTQLQSIRNHEALGPTDRQILRDLLIDIQDALSSVIGGRKP